MQRWKGLENAKIIPSIPLPQHRECHCGNIVKINRHKAICISCKCVVHTDGRITVRAGFPCRSE